MSVRTLCAVVVSPDSRALSRELRAFCSGLAPLLERLEFLVELLDTLSR